MKSKTSSTILRFVTVGLSGIALLACDGAKEEPADDSSAYETWLVDQGYAPTPQVVDGLVCDNPYSVVAHGADGATYQLISIPRKGLTMKAHFEAEPIAGQGLAEFDVTYTTGVDGIGQSRDSCYREKGSVNRSCSSASMFSFGPFGVHQGTSDPSETHVAFELMHHKRVVAGLNAVYQQHGDSLCNR